MRKNTFYMSNSLIKSISGPFLKIPERFFFYFPRLRKQYQKIETLNTIFKKIEEVGFQSFPSLNRCHNRSDLLHDRKKIITSIQNTSIEGKTVQEWLLVAARKLSKARTKDLYTHEKTEWDRLEQQLVGLQYRSGALSKGTTPEKALALFNALEPVIQKYLASPSIFPGRTTSRQLKLQEKEQLEKACARYPAFIEKFLERAKKNPEGLDPWTASFVKWVLRSGCNIGVFVKAPTEKDLLASLHLDKRSGAVDGKKGIHFQDVVVDGVAQRLVCLKIDEKMEPIQGALKKRKVTLKNIINQTAGGITLSIEKILRIFKEKTSDYGDLEYLSGGIRNWNTIKLASFDETTGQYHGIAKDKFLETLLDKVSLPPLSEEQMQERYQNFLPLSPGHWGLGILSSRSKPNLNVMQAHGYQEIVYRKDHSYYILPMGVQPKRFPKNWLEKIFFFSATTPAGIHYVDESFYLSQRNKIGLFFPLTSQETNRLKTHLAENSLLSKQEDLLFQFAGDNCAFHIQKCFDEVIAAPFYEKLQSVLNQYLSSKNIISRLLIQNDSVRAFQGLNHGLLKEILSYVIDDLWNKKESENLKELTYRAIHLLSKVYQETLTAPQLERIDFSRLAAKEEMKKLLFQTIEVARFYRMDLFRSEADQPFLAAINKVIGWAPWRGLKRGIINVVLFLIGSWRWVLTREEKQETILPGIALKNLAANPLLQEGYLNHPAALWEWTALRGQRLTRSKECLNRLELSL